MAFGDEAELAHVDAQDGNSCRRADMAGLEDGSVASEGDEEVDFGELFFRGGDVIPAKEGRAFLIYADVYVPLREEGDHLVGEFQGLDFGFVNDQADGFDGQR